MARHRLRKDMKLLLTLGMSVVLSSVDEWIQEGCWPPELLARLIESLQEIITSFSLCPDTCSLLENWLALEYQALKNRLALSLRWYSKTAASSKVVLVSGPGAEYSHGCVPQNRSLMVRSIPTFSHPLSATMSNDMRGITQLCAKG
ncbi:uncharacterized protein PADG_01467 [Paracoccidioides brasiliensis Pb18]|uniref:Uncharacterized protein n=1 Tax=Paracoccidioides brasiliensis (strain Pb18) TaxID=502780 RepID=C1G3F1_PARBD|nr:uncharacterized protein PADG_01467 [Paracoccidioides brasiliensis Pb18]EEH45317.2 hypothetical protein PADG_01467 [Paracoccidioides brasiliensis Pb18]